MMVSLLAFSIGRTVLSVAAGVLSVIVTGCAPQPAPVDLVMALRARLETIEALRAISELDPVSSGSLWSRWICPQHRHRPPRGSYAFLLRVRRGVPATFGPRCSAI